MDLTHRHAVCLIIIATISTLTSQNFFLFLNLLDILLIFNNKKEKYFTINHK